MYTLIVYQLNPKIIYLRPDRDVVCFISNDLFGHLYYYQIDIIIIIIITIIYENFVSCYFDDGSKTKKINSILSVLIGDRTISRICDAVVYAAYYIIIIINIIIFIIIINIIIFIIIIIIIFNACGCLSSSFDITGFNDNNIIVIKFARSIVAVRPLVKISLISLDFTIDLHIVLSRIGTTVVREMYNNMRVCKYMARQGGEEDKKNNQYHVLTNDRVKHPMSLSLFMIMYCGIGI
ncbi:hypothetical protein AGLY_013129 [Aphis glycines]|uniref:Uncharacterized protein n=1 Tax=Aphis glycines TaxID=307491 RepID=A0A6G0T5F1_APHGL|nr:hypothetical protein AGLY_013129 [Aphis glycines]